MSLVAAMLLGANLYAIDNVKVNGDAKLLYSTSDNTNDGTANGDNGNALFNQKGAAGQAGLSLGLTADLTEGVSAGITANALSTLGLQNNLVSNVWEGTTIDAGGNVAGLQDQFWFSEAWIAGTVGKTTGKVGRMPLDTPLVFSETWSIAQNTFEAGVLMNQDLEDTTIVAAYVGSSNGSENNSVGDGSNLAGGTGNASYASVLAGGQDWTNSPFHSFWNGAYAFGVVNNSVKPLTAQAWYFDALSVAKAYWLQADVDMEGILAGAQYTAIDMAGNNNDNDAFALMVGYAMKDTVTVKVAYSQTGEEKINNTGAGFNLAGSGQSKLYTEAWWNYGYVTSADTSALSLSAEAPVAGFDLGAYYTMTDSGKNGGAVDRPDMTELTLTAGKSFGPLDVSLVYIMTDAEDQNNKAVALDGDSFNTVQAYLTYNF